MSVEPPTFLFVLDESDNEVAGETVFRRHPLHFAHPPSDEPVLGTCKNGAVWISDNSAVQRKSLLDLAETLFPECHAGTAQDLLLESLSRFLRVDPERGMPGGTCEAGNSSRT